MLSPLACFVATEPFTLYAMLLLRWKTKTSITYFISMFRLYREYSMYLRCAHYCSVSLVFTLIQHLYPLYPLGHTVSFCGRPTERGWVLSLDSWWHLSQRTGLPIAASTHDIPLTWCLSRHSDYPGCSGGTTAPCHSGLEMVPKPLHPHIFLSHKMRDKGRPRQRAVAASNSSAQPSREIISHLCVLL